MISFTADHTPRGYHRDGAVGRTIDKAGVAEEFHETLDALRVLEEHTSLDEVLEEHDSYAIRYALVLQSLPDELVLYRGAAKDEAVNGYGQSWTSSKEVASKFAYVYYNSWSYADYPEFDNNNRCVYRTIVPKSNVLMYSNDRMESEYILEDTTDIVTTIVG